MNRQIDAVLREHSIIYNPHHRCVTASHTFTLSLRILIVQIRVTLHHHGIRNPNAILQHLQRHGIPLILAPHPDRFHCMLNPAPIKLPKRNLLQVLLTEALLRTTLMVRP